MQLGLAVVPELRRWGFQEDFGTFFTLRPHGRSTLIFSALEHSHL